jgi:tetratricopeptide (TPR) repeat protein
MLRGEEALAREDLPGASAAVGRETPADDEERLLFARIAAASGDLSRAMEHFEAMERGEQPRYRLARARILADAGRVGDARAAAQEVLRSAPDNSSAQLLLLELQGGEPAALVAAGDIFLERWQAAGLAPRQEGRVHLLRARAWSALHAETKARQAVEQGLARDGTNPDLLVLAAADKAAAGHLVDAAHDLVGVVETRPGHAAAQLARVELLLDLDRVDEADAAVKTLEDRQLLPDVTPVLRTLVSVWGRGEPPPAGLPPLPATPLGAYAKALLAVQAHDAGAFDAVEQARRALEGSTDPFERRLVGRLYGLRLLAAPAGMPAEPLVREAEKTAGDDAVAHVYLGRWYEAAGRRALAAQHFDRAPQLAPELGLGWYEKGRFYLDARDGFSRSGAAWTSYLALAPTGPRADAAKDKLPVR